MPKGVYQRTLETLAHMHSPEYIEKQRASHPSKEFAGIVPETVVRIKGRNCAPVACPDCGKVREIRLYRLSIGEKPRYHRCAMKFRIAHYNPHNKSYKLPTCGDKRITGDGYIKIRLYPDNSYYSMTTLATRSSCSHYGFVLEHRLIMAQHLGRCLESWEIVHHKNRIKTDNRIENLELVPSQSEHQLAQIPLIKMKIEIKRLQQRVLQLEAEVALLRAQSNSYDIDDIVGNEIERRLQQ